LIPAFTETLWLGPIWVRAAKMVGSDFSLNLCNLPVLSSALIAMTAQGIEYFIGRNRCDVLLFGPLSGPAAGIEEILAARLLRPDLTSNAESLGDSCNSYFSLPASSFHSPSKPPEWRVSLPMLPCVNSLS